MVSGLTRISVVPCHGIQLDVETADAADEVGGLLVQIQVVTGLVPVDQTGDIDSDPMNG